MESVDASSRQSAALPPISYLDVEKIKREEAEYQRKHSAAAMPSPPFPYSGPPPPYSHSVPSANPAPGGQPVIISPPESCRTSGDEKDQRQQAPPRQSLPSIHEALATDQPLPYPPPPQPVSLPYPQHQPASLPAYTEHKPHVAEGQNQAASHAHAQPAVRSPYMSHPPPAAQPAYQSDQLLRPSLSSPLNPRLSTLQPLRTAQSPVNTVRPPSCYPSRQPWAPAYSQGHMNQPFGYGYTYSPQHQPAPSSTQSSGPIYSPSTVYSAPPKHQQSNWRSNVTEPGRTDEDASSGRPSGLAYGASVKRHLDNFDLEASLNEIAEGSGQLLQFARHYGRSAHQTERSGPMAGSMPKVAEIEALMQRQQRVQDSLARLHNVVLTQQAALAEQEQDQRYKAADGRELEEHNGYPDEGRAGGFAGADSKKRRGRAAPPGRCHSCNRAETPEWRRGPDGARTLCNACGLHYAKLTRKMGTNKGAAGSSNLRPRSLGPGSPPA